MACNLTVIVVINEIHDSNSNRRRHYFSLRVNALVKGINGFFSFGEATNLGEEKLWYLILPEEEGVR